MSKPTVPVRIASAVFPRDKPKFEDIEVLVDAHTDNLKLPKSTINRLKLQQIGMTRRLVKGQERTIPLYGPIWLQVGKRTAYVDAEITRGLPTIGSDSMSALDVQLTRHASTFCLVPKHKNERHVFALGVR